MPVDLETRVIVQVLGIEKLQALQRAFAQTGRIAGTQAALALRLFARDLASAGAKVPGMQARTLELADNLVALAYAHKLTRKDLLELASELSKTGVRALLQNQASVRGLKGAWGDLATAWEKSNAPLARLMRQLNLTEAFLTDLANVLFPVRKHQRAVARATGAVTRAMGGLARTGAMARAQMTPLQRAFSLFLAPARAAWKVVSAFLHPFRTLSLLFLRGRRSIWQVRREMMGFTSVVQAILMALAALRGNLTAVLFGFSFLYYTIPKVTIPLFVFLTTVGVLSGAMVRVGKQIEDWIFRFGQLTRSTIEGVRAWMLAHFWAMRLGRSFAEVAQVMEQLRLEGLLSATALRAVFALAAARAIDATRAAQIYIQAVGRERENLDALLRVGVRVNKSLIDLTNRRQVAEAAALAILDRYPRASERFARTGVGAWRRILSAARAAWSFFAMPAWQTIFLPVINAIADFAEKLAKLAIGFLRSAKVVAFWKRLQEDLARIVRAHKEELIWLGNAIKRIVIGAFLALFLAIRIGVFLFHRLLRVIRHLRRIFEWFGRILKPVWDWLRRLAQALKAVIFGAPLAQAKKFGIELPRWVKRGLELAALLFERLKERLNAIWIRLWPALQASLGRFLKWLRERIERAQPHIERLGRTFARLYHELILPALILILGKIAAFRESLGETFNWIVVELTPLWEEFWRRLGLVVDLFVAILLTLLNFIVESWIRHKDEILAIISGMWSVIEGIIKIALGTLLGLIGGFLALITGNWEAFGRISGRANELIWEGLGQIWQGGTQILISLWNWFWGTIHDLQGIATGLLCEAMSSTWEWLKGNAEEWWEAIKMALSAIWEAILGILALWLSDIFGALDRGWSDAKTNVEGWWQTIFATMGTIWASILTELDTWLGNLADAVSSGWNTIKSKFDAAFDAILAAFVGPEGFLARLLSSFWAWVTEKAHDFFNIGKGLAASIVRGIERTVQEFLDIFKPDPSNPIAHIISSIREAVTSFVAGLRPSVTVTVTEVVTRTVTEIVRRVIPFQRGAIVTRPTLALVGEAGPEAIVPLRLMKRPAVINITITGNTILDERTCRILADKVSDAILRSMRNRASLGLR